MHASGTSAIETWHLINLFIRAHLRLPALIKREL